MTITILVETPASMPKEGALCLELNSLDMALHGKSNFSCSPS